MCSGSTPNRVVLNRGCGECWKAGVILFHGLCCFKETCLQELSREKRYQKAEHALRSCAFMLTNSSKKFPGIAHMTRSSYARACLKAEQYIDLGCITRELETDCHTGRSRHECLNIFRATPSIVRNFRILWASLPRVQRLEYVYKLIREPFFSFTLSTACMTQAMYSAQFLS